MAKIVTEDKLSITKIAYIHFLLNNPLKEEDMKRIKIFAFTLLLLFAFVGCAPDLSRNEESLSVFCVKMRSCHRLPDAIKPLFARGYNGHLEN